MVSFHLANLRTVLQVRNSLVLSLLLLLSGLRLRLCQAFYDCLARDPPGDGAENDPPNSTRGEMPPPTARNI
jgi:hypothetical protein